MKFNITLTIKVNDVFLVTKKSQQKPGNKPGF